MSQYLHKAQSYHLEDGRIIPDEGKPISKPINEVDLLEDFILLLRECACRTQLYDVYYGVKLEKGFNEKLKNKIRKYKREREEIEQHFLEFANRWGLFGIIHDEAVFDYQKTDSNGDIATLGSPAYAVQAITEPGDVDSYRIIKYDTYAKRFFPHLEGSMPFWPHTVRFITHYSEHIDSILYNQRFISCVDYIRSIDKKKERTLILKNVDISLTLQNEHLKYGGGNAVLKPTDSRVKEVPLVKLCQILLYNNERQPKAEKEIRICSYKRCHKPYRKSERGNKRYSMYCSEKCRKNANKGKNTRPSKKSKLKPLPDKKDH